MDSEIKAAPATTRPTLRTPPSRRTMLIGTLVALVLVAGLGWLAWKLTRPDAVATAAGPGAGGGPAGGGAGGAGPRGPGGGGGGGGGRGAATTVGVATAEKTSIPVVLEALGTAVPQATVRVRPQVNGVLQQVLFKEGQTVRKGDLLAVIDPRQFEMTLQQAVGQRMRDEAQLEAARVTLQRFRTLLEQDSIARQEVDTQTALVKQLEAAVVISKGNEGAARLNLSYTRITAPISGRVGLRTVDVGNVVGTSDTNGVALLTQISPIDVEFAVPQDRAAALQQNTAAMPVQALDRTRSTVLDTGSFASLDNQVDTQTGTVRAKARFANAQLQIFPSQFVNVRLQLRTIENAVLVPVAAVRTGPTGDYVFVLNDDRTVSVRPVTRGQASVDKMQITSGLQAGERVITEGADRLKDGSRVSLGDGSGAGGARGPRGAASGPQDRPGMNGERRRRAASDATGEPLPASAEQTERPSSERRQRAASDAAGGPAAGGERPWGNGERRRRAASDAAAGTDSEASGSPRPARSASRPQP
ncbi:MAG: efflux RND transporter periplasmic adaptor subunit [Pseudomonadota bacterium]